MQYFLVVILVFGHSLCSALSTALHLVLFFFLPRKILSIRFDYLNSIVRVVLADDRGSVIFIATRPGSGLFFHFVSTASIRSFELFRLMHGYPAFIAIRLEIRLIYLYSVITSIRSYELFRRMLEDHIHGHTTGVPVVLPLFHFPTCDSFLSRHLLSPSFALSVDFFLRRSSLPFSVTCFLRRFLPL